MSARQHGRPLWWVRPLSADLVPLDDEGHPFTGDEAAMQRHINGCERDDGRAWCAQEVEQ